MKYKAACLIEKRSSLGERVIWNKQNNSIHYVDITGQKIHTYRLNTCTYTSIHVGQTVGCIVLDDKGNLIAALKDSLAKVNLDTGEISSLLQMEIPDYLRFNDGKCDCKGRLWVGTMCADQTDGRSKHAGILYKIENAAKVEPMFNNLTITNGICWNEDDSIMYHTDTATQQIMRYDFCKETGTLSKGQVAVTVAIEDGAPDGMTIDHEGMLWVALWGGYKVARYNLCNGEKLSEVHVPAKNVSCCAFGGPFMNELFITTAMDENGEGGEVYHVITDVKGFVPYEYKGGFLDE